LAEKGWFWSEANAISFFKKKLNHRIFLEKYGGLKYLLEDISRLGAVRIRPRRDIRKYPRHLARHQPCLEASAARAASINGSTERHSSSVL
jgi:hypothetical protein